MVTGTGAPRALPTGRSGRLLALGILLLLLLLLWQAIASPLLDLYRDRTQALDARRAVAVHMAAQAAQLPALRRLAASSGAHSGPVTLIAGNSDAIAAAALQERVQQMATGLGATLSSTESLPPTPVPAGNYRRVGVRIAITAPFDVMVRLLAAIEQASPSMLIDDLQLHGSRIQLQPNAPIEGSLTVLAFRRGTGAGTGARPADASGTVDDAPGDGDSGGGANGGTP